MYLFLDLSLRLGRTCHSHSLEGWALSLAGKAQTAEHGPFRVRLAENRNVNERSHLALEGFVSTDDSSQLKWQPPVSHFCAVVRQSHT
jgi:hypothetical protein